MKIVSFFRLCGEDIQELVEIEKNRTLMEELPQHIFELEHQVSELLISMENMANENAGLKREIIELNKKIESEPEQINSVSDESVREIDKRLSVFISNFASNSSNVEKRLLKLEAENKSLIGQLMTLAEANKTMNERISQCEIQLIALENENKKLTSQILLLNKENITQTEQIQGIFKKGKILSEYSGKLPDINGTKKESKSKIITKSEPLEQPKKIVGTPSPKKTETVSKTAKPEFEISGDGNDLLHYNGSKPNVIIPQGIKRICTLCFQGCKAESIAIPEGVKVIDTLAFSSCGKLKAVILPKSTRKLANRAFEGCSSLETIIIPMNVTDIANDAFVGCQKLKIRCACNSPAEKFAKSAKIPYIISYFKNCRQCGYNTSILNKKKCPICGSKEWKDNF